MTKEKNKGKQEFINKRRVHGKGEVFKVWEGREEEFGIEMVVRKV